MQTAKGAIERTGRPTNLPEMVHCVLGKLWPTPQASDNRDRGNLSSGAVQRLASKRKQLMLSQVVSEFSGQLNPMWVEWLMGFPADHTALNALETPLSRKSQKSSGGQ